MIELRRFERTLKLRIERKELGTMTASDQREDADSDHACAKNKYVEVAHAEQPAGRDLRVSFPKTVVENARAERLLAFSLGLEQTFHLTSYTY